MKNLPCQKRRHIIVRSKDGNTGEKFRCANSASCRYKEAVGKKECNRCCLRRPLTSIATGKEMPPAAAIWSEPHYNNQSDIVYSAQGCDDAPPPPQGYTHKIQVGRTNWHYKSNWGVCLYRHFMNRRGAQGDLQVIAHCAAQKGRIVSYGDCEKCVAEAAAIGGLLSEEAILEASPPPAEDCPDYPAAVELVARYWKTVKRWIAAGRPIRGEAEVRQIHGNFCAKCDWYDPKQQRCKGCGCKVRPNGVAMLNKIRMKTENCPQNLW